MTVGIYALVLAMLIISFRAYTRVAMILEVEDSTITVHSEARFRHPVMILQHDCRCASTENGRKIAEVSIEQHARYAQARGYIHRVIDKQYVPKTGWTGSDYFNKILMALQVVLEESEKDDGVEWIAQMDTDTLIIDPAIAIHDTLPPDSTHSHATILGQFDSWGFCAGVLFYRVSHHMVTILSRAIALEQDIIRPESAISGRHYAFAEGEKSPIPDQRSLSVLLQNYHDIQDSFYRYPWPLFGSQYLYDGANLEDDENALRAQAHMSGWRDDNFDYTIALGMEEAVYREARNRARALGQDGHGLDLMPVVGRVKSEMARWWNETPSGIDGLVFPSF